MANYDWGVPSPQLDYEPDTKRVSALKRLRQRQGIQKPIDGFPLELFGARDWPELVRLVRDAWSRMPPLRSQTAVGVTLGLDDGSKVLSVIHRRTELAKRWGVSVRTIERLEDEGLALLDYYLSN